MPRLKFECPECQQVNYGRLVHAKHMETHTVPPAEEEVDEEALLDRIAIARQKASEVGGKPKVHEPLNEPVEDDEPEPVLPPTKPSPRIDSDRDIDLKTLGGGYGGPAVPHFDKETKAYCKTKISKYVDRELSSRMAAFAQRSRTPPRPSPPPPPPPPPPEVEPPSYAVARHRLSRRLDDELISGLMKTISQY